LGERGEFVVSGLVALSDGRGRLITLPC